MTPITYFITESYSTKRIRMFAKKLKLNISKIDWTIVIQSFKIYVKFFFEIFRTFFLAEENRYNSDDFEDILKKMSTWSLMNPLNYILVNNCSKSKKKAPN